MTKTKPKSRFSWRKDVVGCDYSIDVVFNDTGDVIASFCYWSLEKETIADAKAFIRAMDRLFARGSFVWPSALTKISAILEDEYYGLSDVPADAKSVPLAASNCDGEILW